MSKHECDLSGEAYTNVNVRSDERFVPYRAATKVMKELDRLVVHGCDGREVGRPARCVVLTGPSGSGKSRLVAEWLSKYPDQVEADGDRRPTLNVEVAQTSTPKQLAQSILIKLGLPTPLATSGSEVMLVERIKHHLREQRVQVLVLDEFQSLLKSKNPKTIFNVGDFVKNLLNACICPIVLVGLPEVELVLEVNEQLERRSNSHLRLTAFDWGEQNDKAEFRALLHKLGDCFKVANAAELGKNQDLALRVHITSRGLLGRAADFVRNAAERARQDDEAILTFDRLRATAESCGSHRDPGWFNPFDDLGPDLTTQLPASDSSARVTKLTKRKKSLRQSDLRPD